MRGIHLSSLFKALSHSLKKNLSPSSKSPSLSLLDFGWPTGKRRLTVVQGEGRRPLAGAAALSSSSLFSLSLALTLFFLLQLTVRALEAGLRLQASGAREGERQQELALSTSFETHNKLKLNQNSTHYGPDSWR